MSTVAPPTTPPARRARLARAVLVLSWLYTLALAAVAVLLWTASDVWWPVTILMYAPRLLLGLPLVVLVPAALLWRPRALRVQLLGALLLVWPVMGLCLPWRTWFQGEATGPRVRVMTFNVHYRELDVPAYRALLAETKPDVVGLQYWSSRFDAAFDPGDWHVHRNGQFYLASRYPIRSAQPLHDPPVAVRYELEAPWGRLTYVNLHLQTPRDALLAVVRGPRSPLRLEGVPALEANVAQRREQSAEITAWLRDVDGPLLIGGDFNTPVESAIYREYWSGYTDAFTAAGFGWGQTQYTPRRTAVRIDHLLADPGWRCRECEVGPDVGSEHRPVFAVWEWRGKE